VTAYSESYRQLVHAGAGLLAFLLRFMTWPQAALLAVAALAFNAVVLPRVMPTLVRPSDAGGRRGLLFHPLSLLALVLIFRERLDIVAAAWVVLAFGDGAATLIGTSVGGPRLPWNPAKTWSGLIAFVLAATIGAVAASVWVAPMIVPPPPWSFTWLARSRRRWWRPSLRRFPSGSTTTSRCRLWPAWYSRLPQPSIRRRFRWKSSTSAIALVGAC